jgi:hypothetical protein
MRTGRSLERAIPLLTIIAAAVGMGSAARSAFYGALLARPVPYWDQWEFVRTLPKVLEGTYGLADLFSLANEHRIATTRLMFFADYYLFDFSSYFLIACIYLLLAVSALAVARLALAEDATRAKLTIAFCIAIGLLWSVSQWENLTWANQLQFPFVHFFALASYWALARALLAQSPRAVAGWTLVACATDFLAVFSLASGLLVLAPALLMAIWLRRFGAPLWIFCALHLSFFTYYFIAPDKPQIGSLGASDVLFMLQFISAYLGTVVREQGSTIVPLVVGGAGLLFVTLACAVATWNALVKRRSLELYSAVVLALAAFVLVEAVATAYGRGSNSYLPTAMVSRYSTASIYFFAALLALAWYASRRPSRLPILRASRVAVLVSAVALIAFSNFRPMNLIEWKARTAEIDRAGFALAGGVFDSSTRMTLYPYPDAIEQSVKLLARRELANFSERWGTIYRPPVEIVLRDGTISKTCDLTVDTVENLGSGWVYVRAHEPDKSSGPRSDWMLAFNERGALVGFTRASTATGTFDLFLNTGIGSFSSSLPITIVFPSTRVTPSCQTVISLQLSPLVIAVLDPFAQVPPQALVQVQPLLEGSAKPKGVPPGAPSAARFGPGSVSGTWDAQTAELSAITFTVPIAADKGRGLAVPFMTGNGTMGLSVIVSAGNDTVQTSLSGRNPLAWHSVMIPEEIIAKGRGDSLSIRFEDNSKEGWLAVSAPYWLRQDSGNGTGAIFGSWATLERYSYEPAKEGVELHLRWRAIEPLTPDILVAVHLIDAKGNILAQHDYRRTKTIAAGGVSEETVTLPSSQLNASVHKLAISLYAKDGSVILAPIDRGPRDWNDHRLLLTLPN